jgi:hypothetical protein
VKGREENKETADRGVACGTLRREVSQGQVYLRKAEIVRREDIRCWVGAYFYCALNTTDR